MALPSNLGSRRKPDVEDVSKTSSLPDPEEPNRPPSEYSGGASEEEEEGDGVYVLEDEMVAPDTDDDEKMVDPDTEADGEMVDADTPGAGNSAKTEEGR